MEVFLILHVRGWEIAGIVGVVKVVVVEVFTGLAENFCNKKEVFRPLKWCVWRDSNARPIP